MIPISSIMTTIALIGLSLTVFVASAVSVLAHEADRLKPNPADRLVCNVAFFVAGVCQLGVLWLASCPWHAAL